MHMVMHERYGREVYCLHNSGGVYMNVDLHTWRTEKPRCIISVSPGGFDPLALRTQWGSAPEGAGGYDAHRFFFRYIPMEVMRNPWRNTTDICNKVW